MNKEIIAKPIVANEDLPSVRELYEESFPKEERIPYERLLQLIGEMHLDWTAYYDAQGLIGFTIVYPSKKYNWFWYFAVKKEFRGQGLGQKILTKLIENYKGRTCILDMESPLQECDNQEQRKRRHAFYHRNGFRDTNVYRTFENVTFTIMMMGEGSFTPQDYDEILAELKQFWWKE